MNKYLKEKITSESHLREELSRIVKKAGINSNENLVENSVELIIDCFNSNSYDQIGFELEKFTETFARLYKKGDTNANIATLEDLCQELKARWLKFNDSNQEPLHKILFKELLETNKQNIEHKKRFLLVKNKKIFEASNGLQSGYYIIGAEPNIGKTTLSISLIIDLLKNNADIQILFFTMDDLSKIIAYRLIAAKSFEQDSNNAIMISMVRVKHYNSMAEINRAGSYEYVANSLQKESLIIKDKANIKTMLDIKSCVKKAVKENNNTVVFIDAVLNIECPNNLRDLAKDDYLANSIDEIAIENDIPVITTHELKKTDDDKKKPITNDLKGSGKYGYNAKMVIMLYPRDKEKFESQVDSVVFVHIKKNKFTRFKGRVAYEVMAESGYMEEIDNYKEMGI